MIKIIVKNTFRGFKPGTIFQLNASKKATVMVGRNGSGKSTLLEALKGHYIANKELPKLRKEFDDKSTPLHTQFMVAHQISQLLGMRDTVLLSANFEIENHYDKMFFYDGVTAGRGDLNRFLVELEAYREKNPSEKILLTLDEFDIGMDIPMQSDIWVKLMVDIKERLNCNLLCVTHSWAFLRKCSEVYDIKTQMYVDRKDYFNRLLGE